MNKVLLAIALSLVCGTINAQDMVKGRITDETSQDLAGVIVSIEGKQGYYSSLEDGSFELPAR